MSDPESSDTPKPKASKGSAIMAIGGVLLSVIFLANLTFGIIEIPDNLPIVGNIDEAVATALLVTCLSRFGIHITPNLDPRKRLKN